MTDRLRELDAYISTIRSMPNEAGDRVRAIDHADAHHLPPLEQWLASDLADTDETEREWLTRHEDISSTATLVDAPRGDAPDRLAQAVGNLIDAGLWPWT